MVVTAELKYRRPDGRGLLTCAILVFVLFPDVLLVRELDVDVLRRRRLSVLICLIGYNDLTLTGMMLTSCI